MRPFVVMIAAVSAAMLLGIPQVPPAVADSPTPPPYVPEPLSVPTTDPSRAVYDDASIHFVAPTGWRRVNMQPSTSDPTQPIVAFLQNKTGDSVAIGISASPFDGSLDSWDQQSESAARTNGGFIEHSQKTTLANGMPAYYVQWLSGTDLTATRTFEYAVVDGQRGIIVSAVSRRLVLDADRAHQYLAPLSVVVYPGKLPY